MVTVMHIGIDHILHTGNPEHVCIDGTWNALGEELEDVSYHKPLSRLYHTASLAAA